MIAMVCIIRKKSLRKFVYFALEQLTYLSNHTLGDLSWVKTVVETETSDVGVSANTLNSCHVLDLLDLGVNTGS